MAVALLVHIDSEADVRRWAKHHSYIVRRSASRAMNEAGRKARTELLRTISDETGLKYKETRRRAAHTIYANPNRLFFSVRYSHRVPLVEHQRGRKNYARTRGGRLRFTGYGGREQTINKAFRYGKARGDKANQRFYLRDPHTKKPRVIFGGTFSDQPRIRGPVTARMVLTFERRFNHALRRAGYTNTKSLRRIGGTAADVGH